MSEFKTMQGRINIFLVIIIFNNIILRKEEKCDSLQSGGSTPMKEYN